MIRIQYGPRSTTETSMGKSELGTMPGPPRPEAANIESVWLVRPLAVGMTVFAPGPDVGRPTLVVELLLNPRIQSHEQRI